MPPSVRRLAPGVQDSLLALRVPSSSRGFKSKSCATGRGSREPSVRHRACGCYPNACRSTASDPQFRCRSTGHGPCSRRFRAPLRSTPPGSSGGMTSGGVFWPGALVRASTQKWKKTSVAHTVRNSSHSRIRPSAPEAVAVWRPGGRYTVPRGARGSARCASVARRRSRGSIGNPRGARDGERRGVGSAVSFESRGGGKRLPGRARSQEGFR